MLKSVFFELRNQRHSSICLLFNRIFNESTYVISNASSHDQWNDDAFFDFASTSDESRFFSFSEFLFTFSSFHFRCHLCFCFNCNKSSFVVLFWFFDSCKSFSFWFFENIVSFANFSRYRLESLFSKLVFSNLSVIVITTIFEFHRFLQIELKSIVELSDEIKQTIVVIVASHFASIFSVFSFRSINSKRVDSFEFVDFFVEWNTDINRLRRVFQKFRKHTVVYRDFSTFRSFLKIRQFSANSFFSDFSTSKRQFISTNASRRRQFYNVLSLDHISTFSFFSLINRNHSRSFSSTSFRRHSFFVEQEKSITIIEISTFDISRHVTIKLDISKSNTSKKFVFENNQSQTSSFTNQTKNIFRDMIDISSSTDVNFVFWNDIMTVIIVFVNVSRFVVEFAFVVDNNDNNDNNSSIIKSAENIDYFDFDYENLFDIDQFIVIFERHNFYRNVFIFIDHFKCLKRIFFVVKVKNLIFICFKNEALRWFETKLIDMKKKHLVEAFIERWCINLIKRFKKRIFSALKKLQTEFYNYVDARRDKTSRSYVQNILRHVKIVEYISKYHQFITIWNNLKLDFRFQILKSTVITTFFVFLKQLDVKKNIFLT